MLQIATGPLCNFVLVSYRMPARSKKNKGQTDLVPKAIYSYDGRAHSKDMRDGTFNRENAANAMNNDQIIQRMRRMFESSLELHSAGQYMKVN